MTLAQVDSRVIVDTSYYYETHPKEAPKLGLIGTSTGDSREVREQCYCGNPDCKLYSSRLHDDRKVEEERMTTFVKDNRIWLGEASRKGDFSDDEQLVLMPGRIWGFVLYSREWRESNSHLVGV